MHEPGGAPLVSPGALTLGCADMDARPLFWTEPDRSRNGYEPRAAQITADELGLSICWVYERWDRFADTLATGRVDAIWCGSAITCERRTRFTYSQPYAAVDEAVVCRADAAIRRVGDLAGRRIGAIRDSTNMALAETLAAGSLVAFDGSSDDVFAEMLDAVERGEIDAMIDDEPAFGGVTESGRFRIVHVARTQRPWGAACRLGDYATAALLNEGLAAAVANGRLAEEWHHWFPAKAVPSVLAGSDR